MPPSVPRQFARNLICMAAVLSLFPWQSKALTETLNNLPKGFNKSGVLPRSPFARFCARIKYSQLFYKRRCKSAQGDFFLFVLF